MTHYQYRWNRLIWLIIGICAVIDAVWMAQTGITADFSGIKPFFIAIGLCTVLSIVYGYLRRDEPIWLLSQVSAQLMLSTPVLGALSYLAARTALPFHDEHLIAIDQSLGFDWKAYIGWVNQNPRLADILTFAYTSAGAQMLGLLIFLFILGNTLHIQRFTALFIIGSLITIVIANSFPAVAGYVYYQIDISQYPGLHPAAERAHEAVLMGMRDHSMNVFRFPVKGIVTFPSFHSTVAVWLVYACWPLGWLRWLSIPLNLLVLMSTPVDGGHYLVDVIGGVLLALAGIWFAQKYIRA